MKPNREQLLKINEVLTHIMNWCPYFSDYQEELLFSEERIEEILEDEEDIDPIEFNFPGEDDLTRVDVEEFLNLADEISSIEIESESIIRTKHRTYFVVG